MEAASERSLQEKVVGLMRDRWETQKQMDKEKNEKKNNKRKQPIPIKDIEQYKKDQQLAKLLQEEEAAQQDLSEDNKEPSNQIDLFRNLKKHKSRIEYNDDEDEEEEQKVEEDPRDYFDSFKSNKNGFESIDNLTNFQ